VPVCGSEQVVGALFDVEAACTARPRPYVIGRTNQEVAMRTRRLGKPGLAVSAIGLRCMAMQRRAFLLASASSVVGLALSACSGPPRRSSAARSSSSGSAAQTPRGKVLLVFFSRAGENYFYGGRKDLAVGNTEVVARMIEDVLGCEVFQIQPVDPYPDSYDATVQRNVREQEQNARPEIAQLPASLDAHDTILLGSPVWNVRAPRIMLTFVERYDFSGKTIYPFTTHAMSGLGRVVDEYTAACRGATLGEALAIQGEEAADSRFAIEAWLRRIGLVDG
jgi:flavodoxin